MPFNILELKLYTCSKKWPDNCGSFLANWISITSLIFANTNKHGMYISLTVERQWKHEDWRQ